MNEQLKTRQEVTISDLVTKSLGRGIILASEGLPADKFDLENGFINLIDVLYRAGAIQPVPANEAESYLIQQYESGKLAENGYGGDEADRFLDIRWVALTNDLPVIINLNL